MVRFEINSKSHVLWKLRTLFIVIVTDKIMLTIKIVGWLD